MGISHLQRSLQQCFVHPYNDLQLLPLRCVHVIILTREARATAAAAAATAAAVLRLALRAVVDNTVLGDDVVVVAAGVCLCAVGGRVVEEHESATCLQVLLYRVHHRCREETEEGRQEPDT